MFFIFINSEVINTSLCRRVVFNGTK